MNPKAKNTLKYRKYDDIDAIIEIGDNIPEMEELGITEETINLAAEMKEEGFCIPHGPRKTATEHGEEGLRLFLGLVRDGIDPYDAADQMERDLEARTGNTLAYKQKFHVGDKVFYIDNKPSENGGFDRDGYVLRDSVVTSVHINVAHETRQSKIVFYKDAYTTRFEYSVCNRWGTVPESSLFPTLEAAEAHAKKMTEMYPEIHVEEQIEGYKTEWR